MEENRPRLMDLSEWLATAARRNPEQCLPLLEKLTAQLAGAQAQNGRIHGKPLIAALLEILREADDSDDPAMIARAIALQDRFLALGLTGMEEMLDSAR